MSMSWQHVDPTPAILVRPPAAVSLDDAHEAIGLWEFYTGKVADDSQRLAVEIMMAKRTGGAWAARSTGREMPRQNGKGDELEIVELFGLVERGDGIDSEKSLFGSLDNIGSKHEMLDVAGRDHDALIAC